MKLIVWVVLMVLGVVSVTALGLDVNNSCYQNTAGVVVYFNEQPDVFTGFGIENSCASGTSVQWVDPVNLSVLGDVTQGEVIVEKTYVFVDSNARPDLDAPAVLTFERVPFAVEPNVLRDGVECGDCNYSYNANLRRMIVEVPGFSNYSLTGRKDFTVYSDPQPELREKVYVSIDLGDAYRNEELACIMQIYGMNEAGDLVLAQTTPERNVQAKLFGSPDQNQPESLGYFPTKNGMANMYFNGQIVAGYSNFEEVIQCSSNSTKLVYEESISTRYVPAGRTLLGRGLWLTDGNNAVYLILGIVLGLIIILLAVNLLKRMFG